MKKHEILSPQSRAALFDPPTDPAEIVRHYTFSPEDLALIRRRRRDANRLGFAVLLAYLRFPGRARGVAEVPPANMLSFIAGQLGCDLTALDGYARREETRWEHLGELQAYLGVRPFQREDYRAVTKVAVEQATGTDRGHAIVSAMVTDLRQRGVILPAALELERIALGARARAREQAYKALIEGIDTDGLCSLQKLLTVDDERGRTGLAWIREWPEAPSQKNLAGIVERLEAVRRIGLEPDRQRRIHQARYATFVREAALVTAQHLNEAGSERRLALLTALVLEQEASLTDAGIIMFDKMLGSMFRRADHAHRERMVDRATRVR